MAVKRTLFIIAVCFGVGLGLAHAAPVAHACSCAEDSSWELALESIDGAADPTAEQAFWHADALLGTDYVNHLYLYLDDERSLALELVQ